jgi:hypothetical protein
MNQHDCTRFTNVATCLPMNRRHFLQLAISGAAATVLPATVPARHAFTTRGVILIPEDFTLADWPERAHQIGLTNLALHHGRSVFEVLKFVNSDAGQDALARARKLGLAIEYALHAMNELLPRWKFDKEPSLFRMDEQGNRVPDYNLCVHSSAALEAVAENAVAIARMLRPSTGRYFYLGDDARPGCRCPKCRELSDSEQALVLENALIKALRRQDAGAQLAHLAYATTLQPPRQVKPDPGIFLAYAPIKRRYDIPYAAQKDGADGLANLEANLGVFPAQTAGVVEYWLDVSRFSRWKRPAKKLPWNREVFQADLDCYAGLGIRDVTSFACYIDADYIKQYGEPQALADYGAGLRNEW